MTTPDPMMHAMALDRVPLAEENGEWVLPCGGRVHYWDGPPRSIAGGAGAKLCGTLIRPGETLLVGTVAPHVHPCTGCTCAWAQEGFPDQVQEARP